MTKEDAIDIIKSECYVFNPLNFDRSTMVNTALDMAVKALEFDLDKHDEEVIKNTVETLWGEPCEDCISRQAVLDKAWDVLYEGKYIQVVDVGDIQDLPPVTTEQESCDDVISRKWLKNAIHNFYKGLIHTPTEEDIQAYIDVAPSVTPKPKTWHWIKVDDEEPIAYDCSECLAMVKRKYNYCPNCVAKMVDVPDIDVGKMEVEE